MSTIGIHKKLMDYPLLLVKIGNILQSLKNLHNPSQKHTKIVHLKEFIYNFSFPKIQTDKDLKLKIYPLNLDQNFFKMPFFNCINYPLQKKKKKKKKKNTHTHKIPA
jgi:hypothetical protein